MAAHPRLRFLSVLIASAAAAWYAWQYLPSSPVDRELVKVMASTTANPPFIIAGAGTQDSPWSLRVLAPYRKADPKKEPVIVSLGDDPEGIFQSSPPSPVDLAVVLKNMHRLGAEKPAISTLLAWEKPEAISISALDNALSVFPAVTTATPLSRGSTGWSIPASFRRASISPEQIQGDTTNVITVNRMPLPGVILGGDNAFSGFTLLEHDPGGTPLLAHWDDRYVLSFPLVAAMVELGLPFEDLRVELGNFIRLGKKGPYIPIDKSGRITTAASKASDSRLFRADLLGDIQEETPLGGNGLVLLRDDQSNAEAPTRAFSARVAPLLADITSGAGMSREQVLQRPEPWREFTILGIVAVLLAIPSSRPRFSRGVLYTVVAVAALAIHLTGFLVTSVWPPTLCVLAAVGGAFFVSHLFFRETAASAPVSVPIDQKRPLPSADTTTSVQAPLRTQETGITEIPPAPAAVTEIETPPLPVSEAPPVSETPLEASPIPAVKKITANKVATKSTAKKSAAKKTAAKKAAAKKTTAKKTGAKKAPRGRKASPEDPPSSLPS